MTKMELVRLLLAGTKTLEVPDPIIGVYFLMMDSEVVYVGQSRDIVQRIRGHRAERRKRFNAIRYVECEPDMLNQLEMRCIKLFRPRHNNESFVRVRKKPQGRLTPLYDLTKRF